MRVHRWKYEQRIRLADINAANSIFDSNMRHIQTFHFVVVQTKNSRQETTDGRSETFHFSTDLRLCMLVYF